ncbi:MAG: hypothetical protein IKE29_12780 [Paenibacillus sp.]|uniref:hypothetical protein n=1 Tax=Paenibacillus sp. TaxID=58172 RepID=UPI0025D9B1C7|nr:hypothetical protein [Paenibacillus sp.]MBR2565485.1 hypothetical protein [Paenibacillus sp.]
MISVQRNLNNAIALRPEGLIPPGYLHNHSSGHARAGGYEGQTPILSLAGHPSMMHLTPGHIL